MRDGCLRRRRYMNIPAAIIATPNTAAMAMPALAPVARPVLPFDELGADVVSAALCSVSEAVPSLLSTVIVLAAALGNQSRLALRRSSAGDSTEDNPLEDAVSGETEGHISLAKTPIAIDSSSALHLDSKQSATFSAYPFDSHAQLCSASPHGFAKRDRETQVFYIKQRKR